MKCGRSINFSPFLQMQLKASDVNKVSWICDKCYKKKKEKLK